MKILAYTALVGALCTAAPVIAQGTPRSGANSPTLTNDNPSSCLGAERAGRNSRGGDREQGGFGQAQSDYVALLNSTGTSFGEFLQTWKMACENAPGGDDDDA